ncbi:hypothetical protein UB34_20925, partial [Photobacterium leiognathi]
GWSSVINYANRTQGVTAPEVTTYDTIGLTGLSDAQKTQLNQWLQDKTLNDSAKIKSAYQIITNGQNKNIDDYYNIAITPDLRNYDPSIIEAALALSVVPTDTIADLQTKVDNLDVDGDGVTFINDSDDADPWTDNDNDTLSDKFESYFASLDPLVNNSSALSTDTDGNGIADFWENDLANSAEGRAAWINQTWKLATDNH